MKGNTLKRCGCIDPATKKQLGQKCSHLRTKGGKWHSGHGAWYLQIELPAAADGRRRPLRTGAYDTQVAAEAVLGQIRAALAVPDSDDLVGQVRVGDLIDELIKNKAPIPPPDKIRQLIGLDMTPTNLPTMAEYLPKWLAGRKAIKQGTRRSYEGHIRLHLIPYLGAYRIDKLRASHIDAMFDAIDVRNETILKLRASGEHADRERVKGQRHVGPTTQHLILATLRKALNDAIRARKIITTNEALLVELPPADRPQAMVWTDQRVLSWRTTGHLPSPVMVWTPEQTATFLDHIYAAGDRLYALYHLIAFSGLRRGEACGVRWDDLDLDSKTMTVRWQIVQQGWATAVDTPKTRGSAAVIAIDTATVAVLAAHRIRQLNERLAAGEAWTQNQVVFTTQTGGQLHPADVTDHFHVCSREAALPPIRLHDLRHGVATMGLAAGVSMKVISGQLRHSDPHFTASTYAHILPELAHSAIEATAAIVPLKRPKTA